MSDPSGGKSSAARPRQLTMAAGFVIGGSVFLMLTVFDSLTTLNSIETRDEITRMLNSPTGEGLGITMSQALASMRVGLMVAGACAAATAVLGIYVLKPNRGARLALSILAVPILLTAPLTGGITGALVVVAILMLWTGPARDWFAGRPVRELPARGKPDKPANQGTVGDHDAPGRGPAAPAGPDPGRAGSCSGRPGRPTGRLTGRPTGTPPRPGPPHPRPSSRTSGSSTQPGATTGFGTRSAAVADRPPGGLADDSGRHSGPDGTGPMATWNVDPSAVPVPVKIACVAHLGLLRVGRPDVRRRAGRPDRGEGPDRRLRRRLPGVEAGQPPAGPPGAGALARRPAVPRLGARCLRARVVHLAPAQLGALAARDQRRRGVRGRVPRLPGRHPAQLAAVLTIVGLFLSTSRAWFEQGTRNTWQGPPSGPRRGHLRAHRRPGRPHDPADSPATRATQSPEQPAARTPAGPLARRQATRLVISGGSGRCPATA